MAIVGSTSRRSGWPIFPQQLAGTRKVYRWQAGGVTGLARALVYAAMKPAHDVPLGAFRGFVYRLDHRLESERIAHLAHLHAVLDVACGHAGLTEDALVILQRGRLAEPALDVLAPLAPLDALLLGRMSCGPRTGS
jgi:hypothetical protein